MRNNRPLTEAQERYVKALVEAWERAESHTLQSLCVLFGVVSTNAPSCHLTAALKKGYVQQAPGGRYMPTMLAIDTYGTMWARREPFPPQQGHMSVGWDIEHVVLSVPGAVLRLGTSSAEELLTHLTDALSSHRGAKEALARQVPN